MAPLFTTILATCLAIIDSIELIPLQTPNRSNPILQVGANTTLGLRQRQYGHETHADETNRSIGTVRPDKGTAIRRLLDGHHTAAAKTFSEKACHKFTGAVGNRTREAFLCLPEELSLQNPERTYTNHAFSRKSESSSV